MNSAVFAIICSSIGYIYYPSAESGGNEAFEKISAADSKKQCYKKDYESTYDLKEDMLQSYTPYMGGFKDLLELLQSNDNLSKEVEPAVDEQQDNTSHKVCKSEIVPVRPHVWKLVVRCL